MEQNREPRNKPKSILSKGDPTYCFENDQKMSVEYSRRIYQSILF